MARFLAPVVAAAGLLAAPGRVAAGPVVFVTTAPSSGMSHLGRVDLATEQYTDIGLTKAGATNLVFTGITFIDGTLYGVANPASGGTGLYTINRATGASTRVGATKISSLFGLAADSTGKLYSISSNAGTPSLIAIDAKTGAATKIGTTLGLTRSFGLPGALAFGATDKLYLNVNFDNSTDRFYSVDKSKGTATLIKSQGSVDLSTAFVFVDKTMYLFNDGKDINTIDLKTGNLTDVSPVKGLPKGVLRIFTAAAVPAPGSGTLLLLGLAGIGILAVARRRLGLESAWTVAPHR
jgi:hypothetical protein